MSLQTPPRRGRPPKLDRDQRETREALLHCGMALLTEQGFLTTGIDTVLREVGVPKGSFYHYFDSKEAFGQAVLARYDAWFAARLEHWLLDESRPPLQRLQDFIEDACAGMARYQFRRGCLVGNLGQEVSALPESFRVPLEAVLRGWEARLARCLRAAQSEGSLPAGLDCDELAAFFWVGWEGAVLRARLVQSDAPLRTFIRGFLALLPQSPSLLSTDDHNNKMRG